jgi:hypothetical protein
VRFTEIGHTGQSERQKYRGCDEVNHASEHEWLVSAPALGERGHCASPRTLVIKLKACYLNCVTQAQNLRFKGSRLSPRQISESLDIAPGLSPYCLGGFQST